MLNEFNLHPFAILHLKLALPTTGTTKSKLSWFNVLLCFYVEIMWPMNRRAFTDEKPPHYMIKPRLAFAVEFIFVELDLLPASASKPAPML